MKPYLHARISAHKFGGDWEQYQPVHDFFDSSKAALADMRHRLLLHSDLGCEIGTRIFSGTPHIEALCRQHQEDDLGRIVSLDEWLSHTRLPELFGRVRIPRSHEGFSEAPLEAAARHFGGSLQAYRPVIDWFRRPLDMSSHPLAPAVLANAFGIMLSERVFGPVIETAPGRLLPTRDIGEAYAIGLWGFIPALGDVLSCMRTRQWMFGADVAETRRRAGQETGLMITD